MHLKTALVKDLMSGLLDELKSNGFVIARNVIPKQLVEEASLAIWNAAGAETDKPSTWYGRKSWNVPIYQHQALWNVRQWPDLYEVFVELLGTRDLMVNVDSACFKPPHRHDDEVGDYDDFIHFDRHPLDDSPILQGLVSLVDTTSNMGGFQCAPDSVKNTEAWLERSDFSHDEYSFSDTSDMTIVRPETRSDCFQLEACPRQWPKHFKHTTSCAIRDDVSDERRCTCHKCGRVRTKASAAVLPSQNN